MLKKKYTKKKKMPKKKYTKKRKYMKKGKYTKKRRLQRGGGETANRRKRQKKRQKAEKQHPAKPRPELAAKPTAEPEEEATSTAIVSKPATATSTALVLKPEANPASEPASTALVLKPELNSPEPHVKISDNITLEPNIKLAPIYNSLAESSLMPGETTSDCPSQNVKVESIPKCMNQTLYKRIALKLHPDKNNGCVDEANTKFKTLYDNKTIQEQKYGDLSDTSYQKCRERREQEAEPPPPPSSSSLPLLQPPPRPSSSPPPAPPPSSPPSSSSQPPPPAPPAPSSSSSSSSSSPPPRPLPPASPPNDCDDYNAMKSKDVNDIVIKSHVGDEVFKNCSSLSSSSSSSPPPPPPPPPRPSRCDYNKLIQNSNDFYDKFPGLLNLDNRIIKIIEPSSKTEERICLFAEKTIPVFHTKLQQLMEDFISIKQNLDSDLQKVYTENYSSNDLVTRLLTKRPICFYGTNDVYRLRDFTTTGNKQTLDFSTPRPSNTPIPVEDYITYDEMAISALLSVSVPTYFINNGNRENKGKISTDNNYEKDGVYVGSVGARFERPELMEYRYMIVSKDQNISENGYGSSASNPDKKKLLQVWAKFYEEKQINDDYYFLTFTEANPETNTTRYFKIKDDTYLDKNIYKKRMRMVIEPFLIDANNRLELFKSQGKTSVYVHAVGLGLGVWAVNEEVQGQIIVDVYTDVFNAISLSDISVVDFSWFPDGIQVNEKHYEKNPNIKFIISKRNPADKLTDETQLLVAQYAWDGNSYPGNEYWNNCLNCSGDPAAACCSLISELQNPEINPSFCQPDKFYIVGGDDVEILKPLDKPEPIDKSSKITELDEIFNIGQLKNTHDGKMFMDKVITHQNNRFEELKQLLTNDNNRKVYIPGKDAESSNFPFKYFILIGAGQAAFNWYNDNGNKYDNCKQTLMSNLTEKYFNMIYNNDVFNYPGFNKDLETNIFSQNIQIIRGIVTKINNNDSICDVICFNYLVMMFNLNKIANDLYSSFSDRVIFTEDLPFHNLSNCNILVWGTKITEWNKPNEGQLTDGHIAFLIKTQRPGSFGIVVSPEDLKEDNVDQLNEESKTKYTNNCSLSLDPIPEGEESKGDEEEEGEGDDNGEEDEGEDEGDGEGDGEEDEEEEGEEGEESKGDEEEEGEGGNESDQLKKCRKNIIEKDKIIKEVRNAKEFTNRLIEEIKKNPNNYEITKQLEMSKKQVEELTEQLKKLNERPTDYLNGKSATKGTEFINKMINCQVNELQKIDINGKSDDDLITEFLNKIKECGKNKTGGLKSKKNKIKSKKNKIKKNKIKSKKNKKKSKKNKIKSKKIDTLKRKYNYIV
jgi:hypothetical protein